jgi:hypothetical protein
VMTPRRSVPPDPAGMPRAVAGVVACMGCEYSRAARGQEG